MTVGNYAVKFHVIENATDGNANDDDDADADDADDGDHQGLNSLIPSFL